MRLSDEQTFNLLDAAKFLDKKINGFTDDDFKKWARNILNDLLNVLVTDDNNKLLAYYDHLLSVKNTITNLNKLGTAYILNLEAINYIVELLRPVIY